MAKYIHKKPTPEAAKAARQKYRATPKGQAAQKQAEAKYKQSERGLEKGREYSKRYQPHRAEGGATRHRLMAESERYMRSPAFHLPLAGPLRHLDHEEH